MNGSQLLIGFGAFLTIALLATGTTVLAAPFTASYSDGGTWDTIFGQGFNSFVNDGGVDPNEFDFGDPVPLTRWEFFKSGEADAATNIRMAIIAPLYADITGLNANDPNGPVVGLSTNTIASTAGIATGDPIRFNFEGGLELVFGDYYGAIMVNVDESGNLTTVLVSALTADYIPTVADPNVFIPETNYDFSADPNGIVIDPVNNADFNTSASNFSHIDEFGTFFDGFTGGGDANFVAYFDTTFPPDLPGDFDFDLDVDGTDFLIWQRGGSPSPFSASDLADWEAYYGTEPLMAVSTAVPEPGSGILACLLLGVAGAFVRVSRRSKKLT